MSGVWPNNVLERPGGSHSLAAAAQRALWAAALTVEVAPALEESEIGEP